MSRARSPAHALINAASFLAELGQLERFFYVDKRTNEMVGGATKIGLRNKTSDKGGRRLYIRMSDN